VRNSQGNPVAILMAAIATDTIMQDIHRLSSPDNKGSMISLVDQNGHVFGNSKARIHFIDQHQQLSQDFVDQVIGRRSGARALRVKGEELIVSYSPMPRLNWGVLIEIQLQRSASAFGITKESWAQWGCSSSGWQWPEEEVSRPYTEGCGTVSITTG